jgi:hypothetical protein
MNAYGHVLNEIVMSCPVDLPRYPSAVHPSFIQSFLITVLLESQKGHVRHPAKLSGQKSGHDDWLTKTGSPGRWHQGLRRLQDMPFTVFDTKALFAFFPSPRVSIKDRKIYDAVTSFSRLVSRNTEQCRVSSAPAVLLLTQFAKEDMDLATDTGQTCQPPHRPWAVDRRRFTHVTVSDDEAVSIVLLQTSKECTRNA